MRDTDMRNDNQGGTRTVFEESGQSDQSWRVAAPVGVNSVVISLMKREQPGQLKMSREVEIEQNLAGCGLVHGLHRLTGRADSIEVRPIRRLRTALINLGPVFSAFGLYLSSRADLLPANECLELAMIPDQSPPMTPYEVLEVVARELGCEVGDAFLRFAGNPYCTNLRFQTHRARLNKGHEVLVRINRPDFEMRLRVDLPLLPTLREPLRMIGLSDLQIESAIAGFRRTLPPQTTLLHQARSLEALGAEAREFSSLRAPMVFRRLCTPRLMVIERPPGDNLQTLISSIRSKRQEAAMGDLAVHLCLTWLRQALLGDLFPVEPYPSNIVILPNQQISFIGGRFARLPAEMKARLLDYLTAVSMKNPVKACSCLLAEMHPGKGAISEEELQFRLQQIDPFRDGDWGDEHYTDSLAERLFVQWRFASEGGWQPGAPLIDFYRGLFIIAAIARRLCPTGDPWLEGLENVRFRSVLQPFRDLYASIMMGLPQRFDEVLTSAVDFFHLFPDPPLAVIVECDRCGAKIEIPSDECDEIDAQLRELGWLVKNRNLCPECVKVNANHSSKIHDRKEIQAKRAF